MSSKEYVYLPKALAHDFDWVHMHWVGQWLYTTIPLTQETVIPSVHKWNVDHVTVQAQALTADEVMAAAEELSVSGYLMVDERSKECYLRRYLYHDNLIKTPNVLVNLANRLAHVGSWEIRAAVVSDLRVLRDRFPDLGGWKRPKVREILEASYQTPEWAWIDDRGRGVLPYSRPDEIVGAEAENGRTNPS